MDGFPRYRTPSGWNALLPPRRVRDALPAERAFPTVVVGAGFTGLAAARRLAELEPDREVLLLDASTIGEGASGRNSGFLSIAPNQPLANRHGGVDDAAARQIRLHKAGMDWLRLLVREHGIDGWEEAPPRITAAATPGGESQARAALARNRGWGIAAETLDGEALRRALGTAYYRWGYRLPGSAFVQPAALVRGLADALPAAVRLVEATPVLRIEGGRPYRITTPRAAFRAGRVLVATNAHARALGLLRDRLVAIYTYAGLTPELSPEEAAGLGALPAWGVIPAHRMGTTLRRVGGTRLLVRSGDSYEREADPDRVRAMLETLFRRRFPHLASHAFAHVWGGVTAITHNGGLFFGAPRPGLFVSAGCNGSGIVRGTIQGRLLAEMACGAGSALLSDRLALEGPNRLPPEPIRRVGALASIALEQIQAGLER